MHQSRTTARRLCLPALAACFTMLTLAPHALARQVAQRQVPATNIAPDLRLRLDALINDLEAARVEHKVPGMAIAVVKDDRLVLARGFGHADLDQNELVTPHTTFAIGSCTKAFTAALIAMLIDEGKMTWDDPLDSHVPYLRFELDTDLEDARVTVADALSHRTGFTRMSLLIMEPDPSNELRLRTAIKAEPWDRYRENFHYTNIMYTAAGECALAANGHDEKDWHDLVRDRLLEPLGMVSARTRYQDITADEGLATPYLWKPALEAFEAVPVRDPSGVAEAGAITANVIDMANWLRLQLGNGEINGARLISEETHATTWEPHISIAPDFDYGLGWMLEKWNGRQVVQHGGNIDGFSAMTAMIPEENLGFVLLMNVSFTPLQEICRPIVWEALLGDPPGEDEGNPQSGDYSDYLGEYLANFGTLENETLTVLEKDGKLAVDIPGQMVFELKPPDDEGKWAFAMTDQIAISFERGDEDQVISLVLHQGGLRLEAPRKGVEFKPEIPMGELQKYLGQYHSDTLDRTDTVVIQNNRLAVNIPGQLIFELHPPDESGMWVFRATDTIRVSFTEDENGRITQMTLHQGGMEFPMDRTGDAPDPLPSVDDILQLRGSNARRRAVAMAGITYSKSTIRVLTAGMEGTIESWGFGSTRARVNTDFGIWGNTESAVDGDYAAERFSFAPYQVHRGRMLEQAQLSNPHTLIGPLMDMFDSLTVVERGEDEGRPVIIVNAKRGELPAWKLYLDVDTGDVLRADVPTVIEGVGAIPVFQRFREYREVNGLRVPMRTEMWSEMSGRIVVEDTTFETNVKIGEQIFRLGPAHVYD